jgi:hypothetical protein
MMYGQLPDVIDNLPASMKNEMRDAVLDYFEYLAEGDKKATEALDG